MVDTVMEQWRGYLRAAPNRRRRRWAYLVTAAIITLVAGWMLWVDLPVARCFHRRGLPGELRRVVMASEFFGHGLSVLLLCWAAGVLDGRGWRITVCLLISGFVPGVLSTALKAVVARHRPQALWDADMMPETIRETFVCWFPAWQRLPEWGYGLQSFPSSHAATAFGLALGFTALYPRGRTVFLTFAALAAFQRIASCAHFPSDVLVGVALAYVAAGWWVTTTGFQRLATGQPGTCPTPECADNDQHEENDQDEE